ncbi:hypothetical protein [Nocardia aurantiaca]|uniref:Uncharacterized protein n=1 Tax=Nocardia aurantiaca TaxID=2675850 RepID=A0A6I3LA01_9NOCA|nr:hypothetical protein [Nocardia aurantiaca]MTE17046.1 hypothetical protein [Nocardia aurantiaca]
MLLHLVTGGAAAQPPTTPPTVPPIVTVPVTPPSHWLPPTPISTTPPAPAIPAPTIGSPTATTTSPAPGPGDFGPGTPGGSPSGSGGQPSCGIDSISACVANAIDGFFRRVVDSAFDPLLGMLSSSLLTTPDPSQLPQVGVLWQQSWQLMLAFYGLLVIASGILLMVRETLQTRWSFAELAPRIVAGFIAGAMSMIVASTAIGISNALAVALSGDGVDPNSAAQALTELAKTPSMEGDIFGLLMALAMVVMLVVLLVTYFVRVAVTIMLIASGPIVLMFHALPGTDSIARWWWRSLGACLAIQVVQSLVLITTLRVFLTPGGWTTYGTWTDTGTVNAIVGLALMAILVKTPFWLMSAMRIGQGRSMIGSMARSYLTYKTFGLIRGGGSSGRRRPTARTKKVAPSGPPDPYAKVRATRDGQLMLPLEGVHRVPRKRRTATGQQPGTAPGPKPAARRAARGRQLAFDFDPPDPYRGTRAGRDGQYRLPLAVTRVPATKAPPTPPPAPAPTPRTRRPQQLAFDFDPPGEPDPYRGVRPNRGGQYPLPIPVTRVKPAPPPPPPLQPPATPSKAAGRQLHLPLPDLPVRRRAFHGRTNTGKGKK